MLFQRSPNILATDRHFQDRAVVRALALVLFLNVLVAAAKIIVGLITERITILADGLHSTIDALNNVVSICMLHIAAKPADDDHPYGHRKFENLAAMFVGGLIFVVAWEIISAVGRELWQYIRGVEIPPQTFEIDFIFIGILVGTLVVNLFVVSWEWQQGKRFDSLLLKADARHTLSDCALTGLSIFSLLFGAVDWWIDPLVAVLVLIVLVRAGWNIIAENIPVLTDHIQLDPAQVRSIAERVAGVLGTHSIRSHGSRRDIHLDLSILIEPGQTAEQAEAIEDAVRQALRTHFPGLSLVALHHSSDSTEL